MSSSLSCVVIVPTFERRVLAERAVRSALRQSYPAAGIVVVDDGSTDDYASVLRLDPRVRVLRLPENRGPGAARNAGLADCTASIVAFLDDDDELDQEFLATVVAALGRSPSSIGLCWTGVTVCVDDDRQRVWTRDFFDRIHDEESLLRAFLAVGLGHGVAVKRECLARVGGFSEEFRLVEDTEWFLRILSHGYRPLPIRGSYVTVHCHSGSRMTDAEFFLRRRRECALLVERMRPTLAAFPYLREMILEMVHLSGADAVEARMTTATEIGNAWA